MSEHENLQFDRAESGGGGSAEAACSSCKKALEGSYYEVNGAVVCPACRGALEREWNKGTSVGRFWSALMFGSLAAAAGTGLYYAILAITGYELGLVAIVVGLGVGFAVRKGSNGRGGWRYQALAMFLTYTSIVAAYVPLIVKAAREQATVGPADSLGAGAKAESTVDSAAAAQAAVPVDSAATAGPSRNPLVALLFLIGLLYALPFMGGLQNIMGLIIIGIGLYEAWKINKPAILNITGPYQVGGAPPAPEPA